MAEYYPVIAEVEYKDEHIKVKTQIRVKPIDLAMLGCKKCDEKGTITDFIGYYKLHNPKDVDYSFMHYGRSYVDIPNKMVKKSMFKSEKIKLLCPKCMKKELKPDAKRLYKFYITKIPNPYLDMASLLNYITNLKWKQRMAQHTGQEVSGFYEDFNAIQQALKSAVEYAKKDKKYKIKVNKVTKEDMEKCMKDYLDRKLLKKI